MDFWSISFPWHIKPFFIFNLGFWEKCRVLRLCFFQIPFHILSATLCIYKVTKTNSFSIHFFLSSSSSSCILDVAEPLLISTFISHSKTLKQSFFAFATSRNRIIKSSYFQLCYKSTHYTTFSLYRYRTQLLFCERNKLPLPILLACIPKHRLPILFHVFITHLALSKGPLVSERHLNALVKIISFLWNLLATDNECLHLN